MSKYIQLVRKTINNHTCCYCNKSIPAHSDAMALVEETQIDSKTIKTITYFCGPNCYNEFECRQYRTEKAMHDAQEIQDREEELT